MPNITENEERIAQEQIDLCNIGPESRSWLESVLAFHREEIEAPLRAENERLREIVERVADWHIQPYAGAPRECLFCGSLEGSHIDSCVSLKARAALPPAAPEEGREGVEP